MIIYPASQNSIVGLKPTLGLLSIDRIIPISKTHDTAGPMGKTVKDTYHLLKSLAELKETITFDKSSLEGKKIGLIINEPVIGYYRTEDEVILNLVKKQFQICGATVSDVRLNNEAFDTKV